jgi:predicted nucleic acid-binding protein
MVVTVADGRSPWLIDKSALERLHRSADPEAWTSRINRGLVHVTTVTLLEAGYSARSAQDLGRILTGPPLAAMPVAYLTPAIEDRALQILTALAERGHHRAPSLPDILIAATAERSGLTILHVDKDFELIAEVTDQPIERLILDTE